MSVDETSSEHSGMTPAEWQRLFAALAGSGEIVMQYEMRRVRAKAVKIYTDRQMGFECYGDVIAATSTTMASSMGDSSCVGVMLDLGFVAMVAENLPAKMIDIATQLVVHELSHAVTNDPMFVNLRSKRRRQAEVESIESQVVPTTVSGDYQNDVHGPDFVRVMLHFASRMQSLGWRVNDDCLMDWEFYRTPRPFEMNRVLRAEMDLLAGVPLSQVAKLPPPAAFLKLWDR